MDRRAFLALIAGAVAAPRCASAAPTIPAPRRIRLLNAHTGEVFDGTYRDDNGPIASALTDLSVFLRDHHSGTCTVMDVGVVDFLSAVMAATGEPSATILSAYRTPETNAMLARTMFGVAENSQHLYGRALDVHFGARLVDAMNAARAMKRGGVGWYPQSGFMHIDTGPVRSWDLDGAGLGNLLFDGRRIAFNLKGEVLVEGPGRLIVGGGKPAVVIPGRSRSAPSASIARLRRTTAASFPPP